MSDKNTNPPAWREYEIAVATFLAALDPKAKVTHNKILPDRDTGAPRQRDVWIEGRLCNLIPIRVLVSCKRYNRTLNEQDIDHFVGELKASKADKGVIYSFDGFNKLAVKKAKANGIGCMKLYRDEPADIPEVLVFPHMYCCYPRLQLAVVWKKDPEGRLRTWNDILDLPSGTSEPDVPTIDFIHSVLSQNQQKVSEQMAANRHLPMDWLFEYTYVETGDERLQLRLRIAQKWDFYEARLNAYNVNGTYSFTENKFVGDIRSPAIATWSSEPGEGWTKCAARPIIKTGHISFSLFFGDIRNAIRKAMGNKQVVPEIDES